MSARTERASASEDQTRPEPPEVTPPPVYARVLRLRSLRLSGMQCLILFEGMVALGVLLALTELVDWWAPVALPATVALMVKINDVAAGAIARDGEAAPARSAGVQRIAVGRAAVSAPPAPTGDVVPGARGADQGARGRLPRQIAT